VPPLTSRSLAFYFGDICYFEFSRKRGLFSDLGFGLKRACIAPGAILEEEGARLGHPAREVLERDGESGKRTLLLASKSKRLLLVRPGCNVIVVRMNLAYTDCWPQGWNRLSMTGSNVAQHWLHSKNWRHFWLGPFSCSGPSHRGQAVARIHSILTCASRVSRGALKQAAQEPFSGDKRGLDPRGSAGRCRKFA
jgi:hypothetical protein